MSYIAVLGAGSWGTTLACILAEKDYDTSLWFHEEELCVEAKETGLNTIYLPGFAIPDNVLLTCNLSETVQKARYIVNAVPAQFMRGVLEKVLPHVRPDAIIINASKGIEKKTLLTASAIISELTDNKTAVLSGPSLALEVIKKLPTAVTIACRDNSTALLLQEIFNTPYFRVYTHDDVIGVSLAGALKNVIAIAAGISDGLLLGNNARAALITRGLAEIKRLGLAAGARKETFSGLSGIGDLILTCTAALSRNYSLGLRLGQGMKLNDILSQTRSVIEGVATAESAKELAQTYNMQMPIVEQVYEVIYEDKEPALAVNDLMTRTLRTEFYE